MAQTLRPDSTISNAGNFLPYDAGSLYNALGDNTSFIYQNNSGTYTCIVGLEDGTEDLTGIVKIEWYSVRTADSEKACWQTMALYQGTTLIASSPEVQITNSSYTWYEYLLSEAEVAAITDRTALRGVITHRIASGDGAMSLRLAQFKITSIATDEGDTLSVDGSPGAVVFDATFEDGTLDYFDGSRGDVFGKDNGLWDISVVSTPAMGNYSAAITLPVGDDPEGISGYLFTYTTTAGRISLHYADVYFPSTMRHPYLSAGWWNIWQHKSVDQNYPKPIISLDCVISGGVEQLVMNNWENGLGANPIQNDWQSPVIPFPRDKWVRIHTKFYSVNNYTGYCIAYQDGVEILRLENIRTRPNDRAVLWSVQSYTNPVTEQFTLYVDNMRIQEDGTGVNGHVTHRHTSETVILTDGVGIDLLVQGVTHGHTSETVTLTSPPTLEVEGVTHGHTSETVTLEVVDSIDLIVQNVSHGHTSETVVLSIVGDTPVSRLYSVMGEIRLNEVLPERRRAEVKEESRKEVIV